MNECSFVSLTVAVACGAAQICGYNVHSVIRTHCGPYMLLLLLLSLSIIIDHLAIKNEDFEFDSNYWLEGSNDWLERVHRKCRKSRSFSLVKGMLLLLLWIEWGANCSFLSGSVFKKSCNRHFSLLVKTFGICFPGWLRVSLARWFLISVLKARRGFIWIGDPFCVWLKFCQNSLTVLWIVTASSVFAFGSFLPWLIGILR